MLILLYITSHHYMVVYYTYSLHVCIYITLSHYIMYFTPPRFMLFITRLHYTVIYYFSHYMLHITPSYCVFTSNISLLHITSLHLLITCYIVIPPYYMLHCYTSLLHVYITTRSSYMLHRDMSLFHIYYNTSSLHAPYIIFSDYMSCYSPPYCILINFTSHYILLLFICYLISPPHCKVKYYNSSLYILHLLVTCLLVTTNFTLLHQIIS